MRSRAIRVLKGQLRAAPVFFAGLWLAASPVGAEPRVPERDDTVLETLPRLAGEDRERIRALDRALDQNPRNLEAALALAVRYSELNAASGDPRYLGYAQAVLEPWWNIREPPFAAWLLRARIEQRLHRFKAAQADLEGLLRAHPDAIEAALLLSTVAIVRGDYPTAQAACRRVASRADALIAAACAANLAPYLGEGSCGLELVDRTLEMAGTPKNALGVWVLTLGAELAVGLGRSELAGDYYRRALSLSNELGEPDLYLLGSYADYLIDEGRPREAARLLEPAPAADPLLIRLAIAQAAIDPSAAREIEDVLERRMRALQMRDAETHAREQAWFHLHVRRDPKAALRHARLNWSVQREMRDARLLLEAALAAGKPDAAAPVLDWMEAGNIDHAWLDVLARRVRAETP
ncbi:hypothetical protein BH24PSE2_BH24PSE2_22700 [soil metagenome]